MLAVFGEQQEIGRTEADMKYGSHEKPWGKLGVRLGQTYITSSGVYSEGTKETYKVF